MGEHLTPARRFASALLLLLPAAYGAWYLFGAWWLVPVASLTELFLPLVYGDSVQGMLRDGVRLFVLLPPELAPGLRLIEVPGAGSEGPFRVFQVYTPPLAAGVPLFFALSLASSTRFLLQAIKLLSGTLILMAGQTISIVVKIGATLFSVAPSLRPSSAICSTDCFWAIIFPVQYFTYLILPMLLGVLTWVVLYRPFRFKPEGRPVNKEPVQPNLT